MWVGTVKSRIFKLGDRTGVKLPRRWRVMPTLEENLEWTMGVAGVSPKPAATSLLPSNSARLGDKNLRSETCGMLRDTQTRTHTHTWVLSTWRSYFFFYFPVSPKPKILFKPRRIPCTSPFFCNYITLTITQTIKQEKQKSRLPNYSLPTPSTN